MKKFLLIVLCAALMGSCGEILDDGLGVNYADTETPVTFKTSVTSMTRVISDLFETGDEIRVDALSDGAEFDLGASYVYANGYFTSSDPIFYETSTQQLSFRAVYPAVEDFAEWFTFSAQTDQSTGDNYEMSDLLVSQTAATYSSCPTLSFNHMMTNVVINITTPNMGDGELVVYGSVDAFIDLSNGWVTVSEYKEYDGVIAATNGSDSYKVILTPQSFTTGTRIATYTVDGVSYDWTLEDGKVFESGCRYTFNWDLIENLVSFDGYINGWEDATTGGDSDSDYEDDYSDFDIGIVCEASECIIETSLYNLVDSTILSSATMVDVISECDWINVKLIDEDEMTVFISVSENSSTDMRQDVIQILVNSDSSEIYLTYVTVTQMGADGSSSSGDSSYDEATRFSYDCIVNGEGGTVDIPVENKISSDITRGIFTSDDTAFVSCEYSEDAMAFVVTVEPMTSTTLSSRDASIEIIYADADGVVYVYEIYITQDQTISK